MSEPFIGQIHMFGFNFPPRGWAKCDGALLSIAQNTALFALLGTTYGGDGRTTFGLPDLRGRVPIHQGTGPGLSPRSQGSKSGLEQTVLTESNLPSHTHTAESTSASTAHVVTPAGNSNDAANNFWADDAGVSSGTYHSGPANAAMNSESVTTVTTTTLEATGNGTPHNNMQPFLTVNFCIALTGIFPSRN